MENRKYIHRFCLGVPGGTNVEECLPVLQKGFRQLNLTLKSTVENVEVYTDNTTLFVILDVCSHSAEHFEKLMEILKSEFGAGKVILLERIFKKNPQKSIAFKTDESFKRTVMTLKLKKEASLIQEYINIHRPENVWPQIITNMDTMGILDMEIYLLAYNAYLIMDTPTRFDLEKSGALWANLPREQAWQTYVAKFQEVNPESKATEKWQAMKQIKTGKYER